MKNFDCIRESLPEPNPTEETISYAAMEKLEQPNDRVVEFYEDKQIKALLHEMDDLVFKLKVFKDTLEQHAEDQEEEKMFPPAHQLFDDAPLESLDPQLAATRKTTQGV